MKTFKETLLEWQKSPTASQYLRKGQLMFNALRDYNPEIARKITGTKLDTFYDDSRIEAFLEFLKTEGIE